MLLLREFMSWTDFTIFELWVYFSTLLITTILLVLKLYKIFQISCLAVFMPLFCGFILNLYFLFIVFVRCWLEYKAFKGPFSKFIVNGMRLCLLLSFTSMIYRKVEGSIETNMPEFNTDYVFVFLPVWVTMCTLSVQVCRSTSH
ncbi:unnamed protein product [Caenorhabditis angaria]|uniref:Uncharacterized protein n=1 Tax=Caenorhabditis angaria TaxID=860376 RepID=A0A9P1IRF6_9PELO|nr:unnamed protein product [Caenorhabditis angaria]